MLLTSMFDNVAFGKWYENNCISLNVGCRPACCKIKKEMHFCIPPSHLSGSFIHYPFWPIYTTGDGLGYGFRLRFLSCTEIGSRDPSLSLCDVKCSAQHNVPNQAESVQCEMFCTAQCT